MHRVFIFMALAAAGCGTLREIAEATRDELAERGGEVVDRIGEAARGDPVAIIGAAAAAVALAAAVAIRVIRKRRAS